MPARYIATPTQRFKLIEAVPGNYGAGTAYPMQANLDTLAEWMYRVKLAWFTAGQYTIDETPPLTNLIQLTIQEGYGTNAPVGAMSAAEGVAGSGNYSITIGQNRWKVGYCVSALDPVFYPSSPPFLDSLPNDSFKAKYSTFDGVLCRDVSYDESVLWLLRSDDDLWYINTAAGEPEYIGYSNPGYPTPPSIYSDGEFLTAASQKIYSVDAAADTYAIVGTQNGYPGGFTGPQTVEVVFSGTVAYELAPGVTDPLHPSNTFWIGVRMDVDVGYYGGLSTVSSVFGSPIPICNLVLYSPISGYMTAQLYAEDDAPYSDQSGVDFTITAKEWWTYVKTGGAAWTWNTGVEL